MPGKTYWYRRRLKGCIAHFWFCCLVGECDGQVEEVGHFREAEAMARLKFISCRARYCTLFVDLGSSSTMYTLNLNTTSSLLDTSLLLLRCRMIDISI